MNEKRLEWLNQNRNRAYPFVNDDGLACNGARIPDCVVLDFLAVDTRSLSSVPEAVFTRYAVHSDGTTVEFTYNGEEISITVPASSTDDYVRLSGSHVFTSSPHDLVNITIVLSRHEYIVEHAGYGEWTFSGKVIPTRVVASEASGVSGISTNGSRNVMVAGTAAGHVTLTDGYRTQPVIQNGKVLVKVGRDFGYDPCSYEHDSSEEATPCSDLMFFFCGQHAGSSGNIQLRGGSGVNITQGGSYEARYDIPDSHGNIGISAGEKVPCIEVAAASSLLRIYTPTADEGSSTGP